MPKARMQDPRTEQRRFIAPTRKFKIGGRKSLRSARMMSNADLRVVYSGSARPKDKQTARYELERRGADLVEELKVEETA